jgi:hypothetical protein
MKQSVWTTSSTSQAQAFITKRKQRLKQINRNIYLKDGDEYEIELFNPNPSYILAKIKIDGDYISGGGIVLRPGERVFLERFLDSNNKFVFKTYNVDGEAEYVGALRNNGLIEVEFYLEKQNGMLYGNSTLTIAGNTGTATIYNPLSTNYFTTTNPNYATTIGSSTLTTNTSTFASYSSNTIETGTTEKGSNSNQKFTNSDRSFEFSSFHTTIWKILPESQKKYDAKELNVLYCGECGSKRKKDTHKFCPHCGTKF